MLSDLACKSAKPQAKPYKKFDGGGLHLLVNPNGSRLWRLKYRYMGKEKLLSIGPYPLISLAEARDIRNQAKKMLAADPPIDPMHQRAENKRAVIRNAENTFKVVALEWIEKNSSCWSKGYTYIRHRLPGITEKRHRLRLMPAAYGRGYKAPKPPSKNGFTSKNRDCQKEGQEAFLTQENAECKS